MVCTCRKDGGGPFGEEEHRIRYERREIEKRTTNGMDIRSNFTVLLLLRVQD